ncbi:serine protease [Nonomuraea sp. NPDC050328]|uniref:serine protease n=1 Tax=Nonomuraea sp. NPDC050328 TaxID=3364361 RepID=UPI0037B13EE4
MNRYVSILLAASLTVGLSAGPAMADDPPPVPTGTRIAAQTHPAIMLTSLTYTAKVSVPTPQFNQAALEEIGTQAGQQALAGKIPSDEQSIMRWAFQQIAKNPDQYLTAIEPYRTVDGEVGGMCTGWWVTPDGYMVTGAHCVQLSERALATQFSTQALKKFNDEDAKALVADLGKSADPELLNLAAQIFATFNATNLQITGLQQSLDVVQTLPGGGVDKSAKFVPAELVSVGEDYPGKDFALLKINGQKNLPTVSLGEDSDVRTGDTLYISGFPGLVTNTDFFSLESRLEPALTEGPFNAMRATKSGVPYIQTQAPSYHGNSGGPVFAANGKVIGMLIAGTVDANGTSSESESFVLPVSVVKEKLNEKNIQPSVSATTTKYNEALDDFFRHHYEAALPKFREVQALQPNHSYVAKYITDTQLAITSGKDQTPQPMWFWIVLGGGILLLVVLGLLFLMILKRRGRRSAARPPVVQGPPPGWQPGTWSPPQVPGGPGQHAPLQQQPARQLPPAPYQQQPHSQPQPPQYPQQYPPQPGHPQSGQQPVQTQYVRRQPSPYDPSQQEIAELERKLADLRRQQNSGG